VEVDQAGWAGLLQPFIEKRVFQVDTTKSWLLILGSIVIVGMHKKTGTGNSHVSAYGHAYDLEKVLQRFQLLRVCFCHFVSQLI
jgi:hypothetical protein